MSQIPARGGDGGGQAGVKKARWEMKDLIVHIVQAIVDHPEDVSVRLIIGDHTNIYQLKVAKSDMGKIIGKHGRTADAIRNLLYAASAKTKKRSVMEIVEDAAFGHPRGDMNASRPPDRTDAVKFRTTQDRGEQKKEMGRETPAGANR